MNMQNMMAQAQKMQRDIEKKKNEINNQLFPGKYEWVEVTLNGKKDMVSMKILKDGIIDEEDKEMLQDMIVLAVKEAIKQIDAEFQSKMGQYAGMLDGLM